MNGPDVKDLRGAIERAQEASIPRVALRVDAFGPGAVVFVVDGGGVCRGRVRSVRVEVTRREVLTLLEVRVLGNDEARFVVRRAAEVFASVNEAAIAAFIDPEPAL